MAQKQKKKSQQSGLGNTGTPVFIALAAGIAGFFIWRKMQQDKDKKSGSNQSPFKFPAAAKQKASTAATASTSNLPRNKTSNNKKNKSRKKEEKAKRAEKKAEKKKQPKGSSSSGGGQQDQASSAVVNYTYFDTARRDTVIPLQKRKTLTAADVMLKEEAEKTSATTTDKN